MNQINPYQLQALSEVLLELYSPVNQAGLPEHFFNVLRKVVPSSVYSYREEAATGLRDLHRELAMATAGPQANVVAAAPARAASFLLLEGAAQCQSSALPASDFRETRLGSLSACPPKRVEQPTAQGRVRQSVVAAPELPGTATKSDAWAFTISLMRASEEFSEAERMSLDFLRPHFVQVYTLCKAAETQRQVPDRKERGVLIVRRDGEPQFLNARAEVLLAKYCESWERGALPKVVRDWVRQLARQAGDARYGDLTKNPLRLERFSKKLIIRLDSNPHAIEYRLTLTEEGAGLSSKPLEHLGLTPREAEVLLWVSQGKSNGEISLILGMKERTVGKHLENIFVKLHVENRTTAAFVALEQLRLAG